MMLCLEPPQYQQERTACQNFSEKFAGNKRKTKFVDKSRSTVTLDGLRRSTHFWSSNILAISLSHLNCQLKLDGLLMRGSRIVILTAMCLEIQDQLLFDHITTGKRRR